jgi:hypothetical protein
VLLINNVEDFADPPTLGTVERAFKKIAHGTYVLTPQRRGHARAFHALLRGDLEAVPGEIQCGSAVGAAGGALTAVFPTVCAKPAVAAVFRPR